MGPLSRNSGVCGRRHFSGMYTDEPRLTRQLSHGAAGSSSSIARRPCAAFFVGGTVAIVGMNRRTGALLSGMDHLLQSLTDILSTRRGTRRERPDYGSDLPDRVDLPITRGWVAAAQAEAARAITR